MHIRTNRGWVRTGLAVLVVGVLGGGVLAVAGGADKPRKITADGVAGASPSASAAPLAPPEPARSDPKVGERVEMGSDGGSVTVSAVEDGVSAGRLFGAGAGQKFVAAEVKGCSGPNERNITFESAYFLLRLDDGTVRDSGPGAKKPSLEGGKVPPGKCLSGWVTFTVPEGALPAAVIYDGSSRTTWTVPMAKNAKQTTTTTLRPGASTVDDRGPGHDLDDEGPTVDDHHHGQGPADHHHGQGDGHDGQVGLDDDHDQALGQHHDHRQAGPGAVPARPRARTRRPPQPPPRPQPRQPPPRPWWPTRQIRRGSPLGFGAWPRILSPLSLIRSSLVSTPSLPTSSLGRSCDRTPPSS